MRLSQKYLRRNKGLKDKRLSCLSNQGSQIPVHMRLILPSTSDLFYLSNKCWSCGSYASFSYEGPCASMSFNYCLRWYHLANDKRRSVILVTFLLKNQGSRKLKRMKDFLWLSYLETLETRRSRSYQIIAFTYNVIPLRNAALLHHK